MKHEINSDTLLRALKAAIAVGPPNLTEILTAMRALRFKSPVAAYRTRRALANALAEGRLDDLSEDARDLCLQVLASVEDDAFLLHENPIAPE